MRGLPRHVLHTLHAYQDEADSLNKDLSVQLSSKLGASDAAYCRHEFTQPES